MKDFQRRSAAWEVKIFDGDPTDLLERISRFGEEALELQQAFGQTREEAQSLLDRVYARPPGLAHLEMGAVLLTMAALANHTGLDMQAAGDLELDRCSTPEMIAKTRRKRATRHGRGALPGDDPSSLPSPGRTT